MCAKILTQKKGYIGTKKKIALKTGRPGWSESQSKKKKKIEIELVMEKKNEIISLKRNNSLSLSEEIQTQNRA